MATPMFACKLYKQRSKQLVEAYLTSLPDAGDYKLVVGICGACPRLL